MFGFYPHDDENRRYGPAELVSKFADYQRAGLAAANATTEGRQPVDAPMTAIRMDVFHTPVPMTEILPLSALEMDWIDSDGPAIRTPPAGRR